VAQVVAAHASAPGDAMSVEGVLEADRWARAEAARRISQLA